MVDFSGDLKTPFYRKGFFIQDIAPSSIITTPHNAYSFFVANQSCTIYDFQIEIGSNINNSTSVFWAIVYTNDGDSPQPSDPLYNNFVQTTAITNVYRIFDPSQNLLLAGTVDGGNNGYTTLPNKRRIKYPLILQPGSKLWYLSEETGGNVGYAVSITIGFKLITG